MENLFSPAFWFDLTPVRLSSAFEVGFFVVFALMILGGLIVRIVNKQRQDKFERLTLSRLAATLLWIGVLGLVWLFLTFEEIQIFGARFWFLVLALAFVASMASIYRYWTIKVPQQRMLEQSKAEANKYLPRRR
jgi:amino acid transporter